MQKITRENLVKSKVTKSMLRHSSQKRLFVQKRNSISTKDLGSSESVRNLGHNSTQSSLVKIKRAPLKNVALMRSQSNLSLYKMSSDKQTRISKDMVTKSSFKSPDFSYRCPKLYGCSNLEYASANLMSTQVATAKNQNSSDLSMEPTTLKNIQFNPKHTRISSSKMGVKREKCKKCTIMAHVSKKCLIDLSEKLQFYMRELLQKDGK
jgi:hypothetical protein